MPRTIFVTGATGFIAKHVVLKLLQRGDRVVCSVRVMARGHEVRQAIFANLGTRMFAEDRLRFVALDLTQDDGWADAMSGCDALIHTASPFPLSSPDNEDDLIRPAVDGSRRALTAAVAAGVPRVVLTSSVAAVSNCPLPEGRPFDERDWTDLASPLAGAYVKSKTLAERAAWEFVGNAGASLGLTVINPSLVLGLPLDDYFGSSVGLVKRILEGNDPMVPNLGFSAVDVDDVAEAHVRALDAPESIGQRIIVASDSLWFHEMAAALKAEFPTRRIPTRIAPTIILRLLGLFDDSIRGIIPALGRNDKFCTDKAHDMLGISFKPSRDALLSSAHYLVDRKLV